MCRRENSLFKATFHTYRKYLQITNTYRKTGDQGIWAYFIWNASSITEFRVAYKAKWANFSTKTKLIIPQIRNSSMNSAALPDNSSKHINRFLLTSCYALPIK